MLDARVVEDDFACGNVEVTINVATNNNLGSSNVAIANVGILAKIDCLASGKQVARGGRVDANFVTCSYEVILNAVGLNFITRSEEDAIEAGLL